MPDHAVWEKLDRITDQLSAQTRLLEQLLASTKNEQKAERYRAPVNERDWPGDLP